MPQGWNVHLHGAGLQVDAFRKEVRFAIEDAYPKGTDARKQRLVGGACALRFVRKIRDDPESDLVTDHSPIEHWTHCGMVYESPFRCTWQSVSRAADPVGELLNNGARTYNHTTNLNTRPRWAAACTRWS